MLYSDNNVVRSVMTSKLQCPSSIIAENYRFISYKYNVYDHDWYGNINKLVKKVFSMYEKRIIIKNNR